MIYIVEDDSDIGEIESYALKNSGFEVSVFETGEQLENALKKNIPEMIILDIMLAGESGIDILSQIKNDYKL